MIIHWPWLLQIRNTKSNQHHCILFSANYKRWFIFTFSLELYCKDSPASWVHTYWRSCPAHSCSQWWGPHLEPLVCLVLEACICEIKDDAWTTPHTMTSWNTNPNKLNIKVRLESCSRCTRPGCSSLPLSEVDKNLTILGHKTSVLIRLIQVS